MHRRLSRGRAFTLLAAVALALGASACSGSGVDKAGGTRTEQPVVLTLANHEQGPEDVLLLDRGGPATLRWVAPHPGAKPVAGPGVRLRQGNDRRRPGRQGPARQGRRPRVRHRRPRQFSGLAGTVPDRRSDPGAARARERARGPDAGRHWQAWPGGAGGAANRSAQAAGPVASAGCGQGLPGCPDRRPGGRAGQGDVRRSWRHPGRVCPRRAAERPRRRGARPRHDQGD